VAYSDHASNTTTLTDTILLDTMPPTTTSDALEAYTGDATITLSAVDASGGSDVASTHYRIDSGADQLGTSIVVPAPALGSASHTVYFWSTDHATNTEPEKSATFTLEALPSDTASPTTTADFDPAAGALYNSAQLVTLDATDTGGSGVDATYYRIDADPFTEGTSFSISEDGLHTFSYYSTDIAGNAESQHVSNEFRIDTTAPVTTSDIASGYSYEGAQLFSLTSTDTGGSGVSATWWQLDSTVGPWTSGTAIAVTAPAFGSVSHTLYWYSVDIATNEEIVQSVTFSVSAPAQSETATVSFRTNGSLGGWSYVYWELRDANGDTIPGCTFTNDDSAHPESMWADFVVPSGVAYQMYGEVGWMPDGPMVDSYTRDITAAEAYAGATIEEWFY
jgi:hypothetical protein